MTIVPPEPSRQLAFATGAATAVVGPGGALLLDCERQDPIVDALSRADDLGDLQAIVDLIWHRGISGLRGFGYVRRETGAHLVLVRGSVQATVVAPDEEPEHLTSEGLRTWREHQVPGRATIRIAVDEAEASDAVYFLEDGVVPAGSLTVFAWES